MSRRTQRVAIAALAAVLVGPSVFGALAAPGPSCRTGPCVAPMNPPLWIRRYDGTFDMLPEAGEDLGQVGAELGVESTPASLVAAEHNRNADVGAWVLYWARSGLEDETGFVAGPDTRVVEMEPDEGPVLYQLSYLQDAGAAGVERISLYGSGQLDLTRGMTLDGYYTLKPIDHTAKFPGVIKADVVRPRTLAVSPDRERIAIAGDLDPRTSDDAFLASHNGTWNATWKRGRDELVSETIRATAIGPGGDRVVVAGAADGNLTVAAYTAANGSRIWAATLDGPGSARACCLEVVDGTVVAVGTADRPGPGQGVAVAGFDLTTGDREWVRPIAGPASPELQSVATEPADGRVYVVADVRGRGAYRLAAVDADGRRAWTAGYGEPVRTVRPVELDVAPDGETVYVAAARRLDAGPDAAADVDALTVAHDAAGGDVVWRAVRGAQAARRTVPSDVVAGPDGKRVFLTGYTVDARQGPGATVEVPDRRVMAGPPSGPDPARRQVGVTNNTVMLTWAYNVVPSP